MNVTGQKLFVEINVWRAIDNTEVIVYRCLHILPDDQYVVKAVDHYHSPLTLEQVRERDFYFVDSMFQDGLEVAAREACPTIEAAIAQFNAEFEL
jgi:hypothetical protein